MRRILLALVSLFLILLGLYALPRSETALRPQSQGPIVGEWVQTSVSDFREGESIGAEISEVDGGEVRLASGERQGSFISVVKEMPFPFNALGSHWIASLPPETDLKLEVRSSADNSSWTDWMEIRLDEDLASDMGESRGALIMVPPGRYLQYRVSLSTADPSISPALEEIGLVYINSQEGPTIEEARAMVLPQEAAPGVPQPPIISRAGWGADESLTNLEPEYERPQKFVIHHTVTSNFSPDPAAAVRAVFYYHAVTLGWGDIGYNFLVDWQGNIYEGRKGGDGVVGAHARRYNYGSIGIALLGNFTSTDITPQMEQALVDLIAWEADRYGIDPRKESYFIDREIPNIVGHRDLLQTSCPGERLYQQMPRIRELTWQELLAHDPRLTIETSVEREAVRGEVEVRVTSISPSTIGLAIYIDGEPVAEGKNPLEWSWDTREYSEGEHLLLALAQGAGGRSTEVSRSLQVDNTPPTGTLTVERGLGFTSQPTVTLTLMAEDEESGVEEMGFTQDGAERFTPWEEFAFLKEWTLSPGEGVKTVGVRFRDGAGNRSPVYTDTIVLDMTPPGGWSDFKSWGQSAALVKVSDELSGLDRKSAEYSLSVDGDSWGEWQPTLASDEGFIIARGPFGRGWIRFRIKDLAGNEGVSPAYLLPEAPQATPTPQMTPTPSPDAQRLPDLVVEGLSLLPEEPRSGEPVTITVTIANVGRAPT
ncbi:MAG: N-acetylmuramoyl-L-alanine amidase, partial [Anaerolineae bacterium]